MSGLGRVPHFDARNLNYLIADVVSAPLDLVKRALLAVRSAINPEPAAAQPGSVYFYDSAWWGDQGDTPHCTAFAMSHAMSDGPVTHPGQNPIIEPHALFAEIRAEDESQGRYYGGDGAT